MIWAWKNCWFRQSKIESKDLEITDYFFFLPPSQDTAPNNLFIWFNRNLRNEVLVVSDNFSILVSISSQSVAFGLRTGGFFHFLTSVCLLSMFAKLREKFKMSNPKLTVTSKDPPSFWKLPLIQSTVVFPHLSMKHMKA